MKNYTESKSKIKYTALSELIGAGGEGFAEGTAKRLVNLKPDKEGLALRNGIMQGPTFGDEIQYSQSLNVNGRIYAFIVSGNRVYEIDTVVSGVTPGDPVYIAESGINTQRCCFFSVGGEIFFFDGRQILMLKDGEAQSTVYGLPEVEVRLDAVPIVRKEVTQQKRNMLNGRVVISLDLPVSTSSLTLEEPPLEVEKLYINGEESSFELTSGNLLALPEPRKKGDNLIIFLRYAPRNLSRLYVRGASEECEGRSYIYTSGSIHRAYIKGGELIIEEESLLLPAGGIKRVFFSGGVPTLALGSGICSFNEEQGTLRQVDSAGVLGKEYICPVGSYAYITTDEDIIKLTVSRSGDTESVRAVMMKDYYPSGSRRQTLSMAYSREEGYLYTLTEDAGDPRVSVLDTERGIWFEVTGVEYPTALLECEDGIIIATATTLYFTSPDLSYDVIDGIYLSIHGEVSLAESFLGQPMTEKLIRRVAATVSGWVESFTVRLRGDGGTEDSYVRSIGASVREFLDYFRMSIGRFRSLELTVGLVGTGNAKLHDVYIGT